jgi:hypothetical protein
VAGNYAADLLPNMLGKKKGFPIGLYLDAKTNSFVEEFSTSNFVAVDAKGAFVTPNSPTVLPSITNKVRPCVCACVRAVLRCCGVQEETGRVSVSVYVVTCFPFPMVGRYRGPLAD